MANAIENLSNQIAGPDGSVSERAQRLTDWLHVAFEWVATDYEQRTVEEILERRAGNCAEQAKVLDALLRAAGIETRWIAEINIHPPSDQRQSDSEALVTEHGLGATVFGYQHNDHRWLELHDRDEWIPADATLGIVDYSDWIEARLGFGERPEEAREMIVPFCIVVLDLDRVLHEDRTGHYLVDKFNDHFDGKLAQLPAWSDWRSRVCELGELGALAFDGRHDLHAERERMAVLLNTCEKLRMEAVANGLA